TFIPRTAKESEKASRNIVPYGDTTMDWVTFGLGKSPKFGSTEAWSRNCGKSGTGTHSSALAPGLRMRTKRLKIYASLVTRASRDVSRINHTTQRNPRRPKDTVTTLPTGPCTPHRRKPSCTRHRMEEATLPQGLRAGLRYPRKISECRIGAHGPGRLHNKE